MNERRANPHGYSQTTQSFFVDALVFILCHVVAFGIAASVGTFIGGIIYRAFAA